MGNTEKFEMMADRYDTPERIEIAKVISLAIQDVLVNPHDKTAMDFGCGTGLVGMNLLQDFQFMLFVDTSAKMIQQIKDKISQSHIYNAKTLCFNLEEESLFDIQVDYIVMSQVLLHIKDIKLILSRLRDVLKDNGHLLVVDFNKNEKVVSDMVHNGFDQSELSELMIKLGYKDIQSQTFYQGSQIFMGQDASLFLLDAVKE